MERKKGKERVCKAVLDQKHLLALVRAVERDRSVCAVAAEKYAVFVTRAELIVAVKSALLANAEPLVTAIAVENYGVSRDLASREGRAAIGTTEKALAYCDLLKMLLTVRLLAEQVA